jgi:hypothetical protein
MKCLICKDLSIGRLIRLLVGNSELEMTIFLVILALMSMWGLAACGRRLTGFSERMVEDKSSPTALNQLIVSVGG